MSEWDQFGGDGGAGGHPQWGSAYRPDVEEPEADAAGGEVPSQDEISEEDAELIGDLGNEFDDPEGWMAERPDYWATLTAADLAESMVPSREALLRFRLLEAWEGLRLLGQGRARLESHAWGSKEEWLRLIETEFEPEPASPAQGEASAPQAPTATPRPSADACSLATPPRIQRVMSATRG